MKDGAIIVIVLRQDPIEMDPKMCAGITRAFREAGRDEPIVYVRTDPKDYLEHDRECQELGADLVILPMERPIPSLAMEHGVAHVALLPVGRIAEIEPLVPRFKPFVPK